MSTQAEHRKLYKERLREPSKRKMAFREALIAKLNTLSHFGAFEYGSNIRLIGQEHWQSSFTIECEMNSDHYGQRLPTGKLRITHAPTGYSSNRSYKEPKAGFDVDLWAQRVYEEFVRDAKEHNAGIERNKRFAALDAERQLAADRLGINRLLIGTRDDGFDVHFDSLTIKQAEAIMRAAVECGAVKRKEGSEDGD